MVSTLVYFLSYQVSNYFSSACQCIFTIATHLKFLPLFVDDIQPWMIWGYYISPMMYGQNAIVINEFLDKRWSSVRFLRTSRQSFLFKIFFRRLELFSALQYTNTVSLLQPNINQNISEPTVGKVLLKARGMFTEDYWYWICLGALFGFSLLFNVCFIAALTFLNRKPSYLIIIIDLVM